MLDRIVMNVIHVMPPVFFVSKQMFPVTPLPQYFLLARIERAFHPKRNEALDLPPPFRKVIIAFGQLPDAVQVVGQYDDGIHRKWATLHDMAESLPQPVNRVFSRQPWAARVSDHGKEITSAGLKGPPVFAHFVWWWIRPAAFIHPTSINSAS